MAGGDDDQRHTHATLRPTLLRISFSSASRVPAVTNGHQARFLWVIQRARAKSRRALNNLQLQFGTEADERTRNCVIFDERRGSPQGNHNSNNMILKYPYYHDGNTTTINTTLLHCYILLHSTVASGVSEEERRLGTSIALPRVRSLFPPSDKLATGTADRAIRTCWGIL